MSVFDVFRGFFSFSSGRNNNRRDPFFDSMTHDEDEDDEDDGFHCNGYLGVGEDSLKFGFSLGSGGVQTEFGQVLREMEELSQLGQREGHLDVPSIAPPSPPEERTEERPSMNKLRDFMLKTPNSDSQGPPRAPHGDPRESPQFPNSPFKGFTPLYKFDDTLRDGHQRSPHEELKEDRDLDSSVQSGSLDQILEDSAMQPRTETKGFSMYFMYESVTETVKPDGSVEERRRVVDSEGNNRTEVTRSGAPGVLEDPQTSPTRPGGVHSSSDLRDDAFLLSMLFKGFK
ncbi:HCLS1-associated protein X-1 [Gouania willdenowi]|uniref:HCLS1-associated protein X-1 n=1 Tax=Gouania willdenowi TaxID=441366 RepID=A0A8C5DH16_GOUWI|nr:HCLS1-associated protein X-1 [Gouania willdenowi]